MAAKPKKPRDHTVFYFASILLLAGSQQMEMVTWDIAVLLRAAFLALAIFSAVLGIAVYWRAQEV